MVKLKLTTWAEERIKDGSQSLTQLDPEVHAAFTTGFIDFGENASVLFNTTVPDMLFIRRPNIPDRGYFLNTWQVYNSPKRVKK